MRLYAPGGGSARTAAACSTTSSARARHPATFSSPTRRAVARPPPLLLARAGGAGGSGGSTPARPLKPAYPGLQEEVDVSHQAFMQAFQGSHPIAAVPGLQEFAAALLDRRRSIPSSAYADPLDHVFAEADGDNDGKLSAEEVSAALRSRGVDASPEIVGRYIRCARDAAGSAHPPGAVSAETIERREFPAFVLAMASADMHHHGPSEGRK